MSISRLRTAISRADYFVATETDTPDEARTTLPLLDVRDGRQLVVFAHHLVEPVSPDSPHPPRILFPFQEVRACLDGGLIEVVPLDPDDFDLILPADAYIGDLGDLVQYDSENYTALVESYIDALSALADCDLLPAGIVNTEESSVLACRLSQAMAVAAERALAVYYEVAGRQMLSWIAAAKSAPR